MSQQVHRRSFLKQASAAVALTSASPFVSLVQGFQAAEKSSNDASTKSLIADLQSPSLFG